MSAWEEIEQKSNAAAGQNIDDGFPPDSQLGQDFDPIAHVGGGDIHDAEPLPQRRGGLNPKIVLAVFSLVVLVAIGAIGSKVYSAMFPAKAVEKSPVSAFTEPTAQESAGVDAPEAQTILGSEPASMAAVAVDASASEPAAIAPSVHATAQQGLQPSAQAAPVSPAGSAAQASAAEAAAQGATISAIQALDNSMNSKFDAVNKRMDAVEAKVASLSAAGAAAKPAASAASKAGSSQGQKPQARRVAASTSKAGKGPAKAEEKDSANGSDSSDVANFKLRAVYPPQGQDRQAWVIGKAGDVHTVVKGSTLAGMRVIRVEVDQVVTDRGTIR